MQCVIDLSEKLNTGTYLLDFPTRLLAQDICDIARSVGFWANYVSTGTRKHYVQINTEMKSKRICTIDSAGENECQCISVSHDSKVYFTNNFTVTHNTIQTISATMISGGYPALVIAPSGLKSNWYNEVNKWVGDKAIIVESKNDIKDAFNKAFLGQVDFVIMHYQQLKHLYPDFNKIIGGFEIPSKEFQSTNIFNTLIVDEAHMIKSQTSSQSALVKMISKGKDYIYLLTGTPVVNKITDIIAMIDILGRMKEFGGESTFRSLYSNQNKRSLDTLRNKLNQSFYFSRNKSELADQLPTKSRIKVDLEIPLNEYNDVAFNAETYHILQTTIAKYKIPQVVRYIRDLLLNDVKIVVFASRIESGDALKNALPKISTRISAFTPSNIRNELVQNFNTDPNIKVLISSPKIGGTGFNITGATEIVWAELPWTYADLIQGEDRLHRIGQKSDVTSHLLCVKNTFDDRIYDIITRKQDLVNSSTNNRDEAGNLSEAERMRMRLIDGYKSAEYTSI